MSLVLRTSGGLTGRSDPSASFIKPMQWMAKVLMISTLEKILELTRRTMRTVKSC